MKTFILTQAQKEHDVNKLHDAFIAAALIPNSVESTGTGSRFEFLDLVTDQSIQSVVTAYVFSPPPSPVDIRQSWQNYKSAINSATNVAQIKSALTTELGVLLKEVLKTRDGGLT